MRSFIAGIALTYSAFIADAAAQDWPDRDKAVRDCFYTSPDQPDRLIAGCTKLIALGWNLDSKSYSQLLVNLGVARWKKKDLAKAEKDFDAAVKMNPRLLPAYIDRASIRIVLGKPEEALTDLNYVLSKEPNQPAALSIRCAARAALNKDLDAALADCDQSLKIRPHHEDALSNRAWVLYRKGELEKALASADESLAAVPSDAAHLALRGYIRKRLGDVAGGNADIGAAIALEPGAGAEYRQYGVGAD